MPIHGIHDVHVRVLPGWVTREGLYTIVHTVHNAYAMLVMSTVINARPCKLYAFTKAEESMGDQELDCKAESLSHCKEVAYVLRGTISNQADKRN